MTIASQEPRAETDAASEVLAIVGTIAGELRPGRRPPALGLDASLERDAGLDSLGRVELAARLERAFGVKLGEGALSAETPRDLLAAVLAAAVPGAAEEAGLAEPLAEAEAAPERTRTLLEVLDWHAGRHPQRRHVLFLPGDPGQGPPEELSYGELARRARAVAAGLREQGFRPGRTAALMLPSGLDYFAAFVGVLAAGGVPVPLYPPARRSQIEDHLRRQARILTTAEVDVLVTFPEVRPLARLLSAQVPSLERLAIVPELERAGAAAGSEPTPDVTGDDVAFLQFTSGSTGDPKGVVLTHANLLANLRAMGRAVEIGPRDVVVSWLPLYHDMGLIGTWMGSLYFGLPLVLMSPLAFLARPSRWLRAIHRYGGTLSAAPNFAYELSATKIADAELEEIGGLDLSSWRLALNGAEPVSPESMRRFVERFAPHGFRAEAMVPVYGLAECSLGLAFPPLGRPPVVDAVERDAFERSGRAVPAPPDDARALRFVSCGRPLPGHELRIVDAAGRELPERRAGRIEFRGPSATSGYYRNPEATAKLVRGEWLDSGDLGYLAGGEVHVTGRAKDVIIRAGRNVYPQELEAVVGELPGVRKGCVAVVGSADPATGTERLVVLAETRERAPEARERLRQAILDATVDLLGAPADEVVLVPPHGVPKTSSGKIRRAAARELWESGRLGRGAAALWWQLARLAASGARVRLGHALRDTAGSLWAAWAWLLYGLAAVPLWPAVSMLPGDRPRRLAHHAARLLARLAGLSVEVRGLEHLPAGPAVVAANHASYLDGYVLTAALPPRFAFVVKSELARSPLTRLPLAGLGVVFVERFEAARGAAEAGKALAAVAGGESIIVFPEGTFQRAPGLLPFRLGAFAVAAEAGVPVVPVAIRGTRSILTGGSWRPRRGAVSVTVLPPVHPRGSRGAGWAAAVALRDAVRAAVLARCGEPDLGSE